MTQPDQAGQETAAPLNAPAQFNVNPIAALTEANALVGWFQNRNLLLAHDLVSLQAENADYRRQIRDLVATVTRLEEQIAALPPVFGPLRTEEE